MNTYLLYVGSGCPYCKRVIEFIERNDIPVSTVDVWDDEDAMEELTNMTGGRRTVPCLKFEDQYMHESLEIIEMLRAKFLKKEL